LQNQRLVLHWDFANVLMRVGNSFLIDCCSLNFFNSIAYNVSGIAEGGEIEAKSFDFAPRLAKTNLYEINLRKKTNIIRFWR